MEKRDRTLLFLFATMSLWILHTAAPVLDGHFPILYLQGVRGEVQIPLEQALNQIVGVATSLSAFAWLHSVVDGRRWPQWTAIPFLFFTYFVWTGHGIHTACVIAERLQSKEEEPFFPVFNLLDFLHEKVSHNMFVGGYCGMLMTIMCVEVFLAVQWLKAQKQGEKRNRRWLQSHLVYTMFFEWLWPLIIGLYLSIFASKTGTMVATSFFYFCVTALSLLAYRSLSSLGLSIKDMYVYGNSNILTLTTFVKASVVGIISLLVIVW